MKIPLPISIYCSLSALLPLSLYSLGQSSKPYRASITTQYTYQGQYTHVLTTKRKPRDSLQTPIFKPRGKQDGLHECEVVIINDISALAWCYEAGFLLLSTK